MYLRSGLLYNMYSKGNQNGNNPDIVIIDLKNGFSAEFGLGFNLYPLLETSYLCELIYSYNKPEYTYHLGPRYFMTDTGETYTDRFNFNVIIFRFGVIFRII